MNSTYEQGNINPRENTKLKLIRHIIINTNEPLLIKNTLNWELLKWDLSKWHKALGNEKLPFRSGKKIFTSNPQFENTTETVQLNFRELAETDPKNWFYFDYKYLKDWLTNIVEIRKGIDWSLFGFPELGADDSTIWIGSEGAHTPCHVDTYGCNIVAQIYGKKRWILFPPEENLQPTRMPYEESSVYSKLNIYAPEIDRFKNVRNCRSVVLSPGDVLVLPHRWWHYVENLELAISINTWIQLPVDHTERLKEAIVQTLVLQVVNRLDETVRSQFINPTNDQQCILDKDELLNSIRTILLCKKCLKSNQKPNADHFNCTQTLENFKNIEIIKKMSHEAFIALLEQQRNKFAVIERANDSSTDVEIEEIKKVFDAMLHGDVINLIKEKLLEGD